ncbi:hypothetical protein ACEPAF_2083 [Sanghuangporus sanghuang]
MCLARSTGTSRSRVQVTAPRRNRNQTSTKGQKDNQTVKYFPREFLKVPLKPQGIRTRHAICDTRSSQLSSHPTSSRIRLALKEIFRTSLPDSLSPRRSPESRNAKSKKPSARIPPAVFILSHSSAPVIEQPTSCTSHASSDYSADASSTSTELSDASESDRIADANSDSEEEARIFEVDKARIIGWLCGMDTWDLSDKNERDETDTKFEPEKTHSPSSKRRHLTELDSEVEFLGTTEEPKESINNSLEARSTESPTGLLGSEIICDPSRMLSMVSDDTKWTDIATLNDATILDQLEEVEDQPCGTLVQSDETIMEIDEFDCHEPDYEDDVNMLEDDFEERLYDYLVHGTAVATWDIAKRCLKAVDVLEPKKVLHRTSDKATKVQRRFHPYAHSAGSHSNKESGSTLTDPFVDHFANYELRWKQINDDPEQTLAFADIPWPIFPVVNSPEDVTEDRIDDFFQFIRFSDDIGCMSRPLTRLKKIAHCELVKRWCLDKFTKSVLPRIIDPKEKQSVRFAASTVEGYLTRLKNL